jgi:GntR family transcriptional regulator
MLTGHAVYDRVEATPDMAADFKIVAGTPLLHRQYRTASKSDDASVYLNHSYIPVDLIEDNPELLDAGNEPWPGGTLHQLRTVGIEVATIIDEVTARPPTPDEARALDVEPGTAAIVIRKTSVDTDGQVVEIAETILPGDRTELVYTTNLEPWT